jgi:hypothetical protein
MMSYASQVSLLLCTFVVVLTACALPFVNSGQRQTQCSPIPWGSVAVAALLLVLSTWWIRLHPASSDEIMHAVALTSALVGGVTLKWLLEILAHKPLMLHETSFMRSLIVAPLVVVLAGDRVFAINLAPRTLLLWMGAGFVCHTFVSDFVRMRTPERVIVRRVER